MSELKKDPKIRAIEIEGRAQRKAQGCFKNYAESSALHIEAAQLFETAKNREEAALNYCAAADVLRLQEPVKIDYHEIAKNLEKAKNIYRKEFKDECIDVYKELIKIYSDQLPRPNELGKCEMELGDYYISRKNYLEGVRLLESGRNRFAQVDGEKVSFMKDYYIPLGNVYVNVFGMYKKASVIYRECINILGGNADNDLLFRYGVSILAYEVSNKDEVDGIPEEMKKYNLGLALDMDIPALSAKMSDAVFTNGVFERIREGVLLNAIVKALSENDSDGFTTQLAGNIRQINTDDAQSNCLIKVKQFFNNDVQPSVL